MEQFYFDHEKLRVYQESVTFVTWVEDLLEKLATKKASVINQIERASSSIPLNIAEGNGKFTAPDRSRFLDNARGSALESAACLDVMVAKGLLSKDEIIHGKEMLKAIVSMLVGLIKSVSDRVYESRAEYPKKKA